ncbi:MAG TPA: hypothetical protein VEJ18_22595 [Planctomycetota bacterium]|nr:hypothetical protein [Planctomycetota bacterium]
MRGFAVTATLLLGLFATAEFAYRRRFDAELARLERRLRDAHPGVAIRLTVTRFRGETLRPSLAGDLHEAVRHRLDWAVGLKSRLDACDAGNPRAAAYAYAFASACLDPGFHDYLWSPRRLRFEPWHGSPLPDGPCPCLAARTP